MENHLVGEQFMNFVLKRNYLGLNSIMNYTKNTVSALMDQENEEEDQVYPYLSHY